MHRALKDLPEKGTIIHTMISDLIAEPDMNRKQSIIEEICVIIIQEMKNKELTDSSSDFLLDHADSVNNRIFNKALRERVTAMI